MMLKRAFYLLVFLFLSGTASAQINIYMGGTFQGNYSWIRGDEPTLNPGLGGGFSFIYWEFEYWFIKAGLNYNYQSSSCLEYPEDYGVAITHPDDKINITFNEQTVGVPLTVYFRPYESGSNTLLITGTLKPLFVTRSKLHSEEYGELILTGSDLKTRIKTNVGFGIGYQRQLDQHVFLNIIPTFNTDIRATRAYNSITLNVELIFGVY